MDIDHSRHSTLQCSDISSGPKSDSASTELSCDATGWVSSHAEQDIQPHTAVKLPSSALLPILSAPTEHRTGSDHPPLETASSKPDGSDTALALLPDDAYVSTIDDGYEYEYVAVKEFNTWTRYNSTVRVRASKIDTFKPPEESVNHRMASMSISSPSTSTTSDSDLAGRPFSPDSDSFWKSDASPFHPKAKEILDASSWFDDFVEEEKDGLEEY